MKDDRPEVFSLLGLGTYQDYLATPLWKGIRELVLKRSRSNCCICQGHANQVHHRSYDRDTLLGVTIEKLVPLCERCHRAVEFDGDRKRTPEEAEAKIDGYINPKAPDHSKLSDLDRILKDVPRLEDRRECDLLAMLMVSPSLLPFVTGTISPEEIQNSALRHLIEHLVGLSATREVLGFETIRASTESVDLRSLVVWLVDLARVYGLSRKLRESGKDPADGCPNILRNALNEFVWLRERRSHIARAALSAPAEDGKQTPDELLRQAQQFHQRRANRTPAGVDL